MADPLAIDVDGPLTIAPPRDETEAAFGARGFGTRLWDQTAAALAKNNFLANAFDPVSPPDAARYDPDFDVMSRLTEREKGYAHRFANAQSDRDVEYLRNRILKDGELDEKLASGPVKPWVMETLAGIVDLPTLLPIVGPMSSAGKGAITLGLNAAAGAVVQEIGVSSARVTRTQEEALASMIMAAGAGGLLGAGFGALARGEAATAAKTALVAAPSLRGDILTALRASGAGEQPAVSRQLLEGTGLSTVLGAEARARTPFSLDVAPPPRSLRDIPEPVALELAMRAEPKAFDAVAAAEAKVLALEERLATLERQAGEDLLDEIAKRQEAQAWSDATGRTAVEQALRRRPPDAQGPERLGGETGLRTGVDDLPKLRKALAEAETERADALAKAWNVSADTYRRMLGVDAKMTKEAAAELTDFLAARFDDVEGSKLFDELIGLDAPISDVLRLNGMARPDLASKDPLAFIDGVAARHAALLEKKGGAKPGTTQEPPADVMTGPPEAKSLSAAAAAPAGYGAKDVASLAASSWGVVGLTAALAKIGLAPIGVKLATSPIAYSRRLVRQIADSGIISNGERTGEIMAPGGGYAARVGALRGIRDTMLARHNELWAEHAAERVKAGLKPLKTAEFNREVGWALTHGDEAGGAFKGDALITKAAKEWRAQVYDPLLKMAKEFDLITDAMVARTGKTAQSYLNRSYLHDMINAKRADFHRMVTSWFDAHGMTAAEKKAAAEGTGPEAYELANAAIDNIMGTSTGRLPFKLSPPNARGPAKERVLMVPNDYQFDGVKMADFLDHDVMRTSAQYVNTMSAEIELHRGWKDGQAGFDAELKAIRDEARKLAEDLPSEKAKVRVLKRAEQDISDLQWLLDNYRGTARVPADPAMQGLVATSRNVRTGLSMFRLGGAIFSQLSDLARMQMIEGIARTYGTGIMDMVTGFKGLKIGMAEAKRAHQALDMTNDATARALLDLGDPAVTSGKFSRGMDVASHYYFMATMISPWQAIGKSYASLLSADTMIRAALTHAKGEKLTGRMLERATQAGLGPEELTALANEARNFTKHNGLYVANTDKWKDPAAIDAFRRGLYQQVEQAMISPGAIDKPRWASSSEAGRHLSQFKGFSFASMSRTTIHLAQHRDARSMNAIMAGVGFGIMGEMLRDLAANGEIRDRTPLQWTRAGFDKSGMMFMFTEPDAILGAAGISPVSMLAGERNLRTDPSQFVSRLLGPTAGAVADVGTAALRASDGTITQRDARRLVGLTPLAPLQNWFASRYIMGQFGEALGDELGIPKTKPKGPVLP